MIPLSVSQVKQYAIPLIRRCMGDEVGDIAAQVWEPEEEPMATNLWGLFDGERLIVVTGLGSSISGRKTWLGYLAVDENWRRRGMGKRALRFAEEQAVQRGFSEMYVETYSHPTFEAACRMYEAAGYIRVGELCDYLEDGSDALYYWKRLRSPG